MSDDLLKSLGNVGREERSAADRDVVEAPPIDDLARERMVNAAFESLGVAVEKPRSAERRQDDATKRKGGWRFGVAVALAVAAAIALFVGFRRESLPSYELSVQGGTTEWRGEEQHTRGKVTVRADGTLELLFRPAQPVKGSIEARAYAVQKGGGKVKTLPSEVSAQGVVRVVGRVDELLGVPEAIEEQWDVLVTVGERGHVPDSYLQARSSTDVRNAELTVIVTRN